MTAEELRKLHADYRHAIEVARDEAASEEARTKASADTIDLRHKLDEELIQDKEDREADAIKAAIESRDWASSIAAVTKRKGPEPTFSGPQWEAFRRGDITSVRFEVPCEFRTTTDMTTADTSAYGSYTIPQTWADQVRLFEVAMSGVLQAGPTIITTANANQINTPILSTDMTTAARTEGSANTDSTYPVFSTVPLNGYPLSGWVSISDELLRDSGVQMEALLGQLAGRSLGAKIGSYLGDIDIGTGSSTIAAITVGVTSAATCASQTAVTVDELKTLYAAVLPGYRVNGKFIANSAVTLSTMLAKESGTGAYLWQPALAAGQPDTFMGKPWIEDAYFDASASGNIPVVFGDVAAAYIVRFVGGIQVDFSRDYQFPSFETSMRFQRVLDAATMDTIAVKGLTLA